MAMLTITVEMLCELAHTPEISVAEMTVIGPVGPLICDGVPPNREAKMPIMMAPVRPAKAPIAPAPTFGSSITPNA